MAALTLPTPEEVIAITGTTLDPVLVQTIIDDAALMVESCVKNLSPERQKAIIKWVAAHMVSSIAVDSDSGGLLLSSEKLGDASESYARGSLGEGLASTYFGQQALLLDPCGCLANIGKPPATIEVI